MKVILSRKQTILLKSFFIQFEKSHLKYKTESLKKYILLRILIFLSDHFVVRKPLIISFFLLSEMQLFLWVLDNEESIESVSFTLFFNTFRQIFGLSVFLSICVLAFLNIIICTEIYMRYWRILQYVSYWSS